MYDGMVTLGVMSPDRADNALYARTTAAKNPEAVQVDDQFLPWVPRGTFWVSFNGNTSQFSPAEKIEKARAYADSKIEAERRATEKYERNVYWSKVRADVLKRDRFTCRICGLSGDSSLHVHHIMKQKEGGTDHKDNLITVCPKCHKAADTKLYNPDWA